MRPITIPPVSAIAWLSMPFTSSSPERPLAGLEPLRGPFGPPQGRGAVHHSVIESHALWPIRRVREPFSPLRRPPAGSLVNSLAPFGQLAAAVFTPIPKALYAYAPAPQTAQPRPLRARFAFSEVWLPLSIAKANWLSGSLLRK